MDVWTGTFAAFSTCKAQKLYSYLSLLHCLAGDSGAGVLAAPCDMHALFTTVRLAWAKVLALVSLMVGCTLQT